MNHEHPKIAAGTLVNQLRRLRHSSHDRKQMMLLFMSSKYGSLPHERRNLSIHIFIFQLSLTGILYFSRGKGKKVKRLENKADGASLSEAKQCLEI
jgi:hypothetical protein